MIKTGEKILVSAEGAGSRDILCGTISHIDSCTIQVDVEIPLSPLPEILKRPVENHRLIVKDGEQAIEIEAYYREVKKPSTIVFQSGGMMNSREARRHVRYHVHLVIDYQIAGENSFTESTEKESSELYLSESGVGFYSDKAFAKDDEIDIRLHIPGDPKPLKLNSRVVYSRKNKSGARVGVKFCEMKPEIKYRLLKYLDTIASASNAVIDNSLGTTAYK